MKVITRCVLDLETMEWIREEEESDIYSGPVARMCGGATNSQKSLQGEEESFDSVLNSEQQEQFAQQQAIMQNLNQSLTPIVEAGPNQQGFNAEELAAMNTQALDTSSANYSSAARALGTSLAGRSSDTGLETGVQQQIKAALASQAAGNLSNTENAITQSDYAQGNANWQRASAGLQALNGTYNPDSYANSLNNADQNTAQLDQTIEEENSAGLSSLVGGLTGIAGDVAGGVGNLDTTGGSSFGEQVGNFASGFGL
jgi:hypothetical protein